MSKTKKTRWGYIDTSGRVVIDFLFDHAAPFREGLALVRSGSRHGYISLTGEFAIPPQFGDESQGFKEELAFVQSVNGKCGFIDKMGRFVIPPEFDWGQSFSGGFALIAVNERYGFINREGEVIIDPIYTLADDFSEGFANVCDGDQWNFIDSNNQVAFGPFGSAGRFSEGVARVWNDDGNALLRVDGKVVDLKGLSWLSEYFSNGLIEFSKADKSGYLNRDGVVVIPPQFDQATTFNEDRAAVQIAGKWGFIDKTGAQVIEPRFDQVGSFVNGLARVQIGRDSSYLKQNGEVLFSTKLNTFWPIFEGVTPVYE